MESKTKYFGGFSSPESIAEEFSGYDYAEGKRKADPKVVWPTEDEILFASYEGGSYEGDAIVLFERDGKLYEAHGSHCSCYGLEDQWGPEETSWDAINLRPRKGYESKLSDYSYDKETIKAFWDLVDEHVVKPEVEREA
jgi:hypothetical protein